MPSKKLLALTVAGMLTFVGCGGDTTEDEVTGGDNAVAQPVPPQAVTLITTDKAVEFVESLESEPVTISIDNKSKAKRLFVIFARLNEGVSKDKVVKGLKSGDEKVLRLITVAGGIFLDDKSPGTATIQFPEGTYVTGDPESSKIKPAFFEVGPATGDPVAEPESLGTISVGEYFFKTEEPLAGGPGLYRIENAGEQSHELIVSKGKKEVGFMLAPAPGGVMWAPIGKPLKPGKYEFVCFFPDTKTGKPHAKLGMKSTIVVK